jgi:hypothetical protein
VSHGKPFRSLCRNSSIERNLSHSQFLGPFRIVYSSTLYLGTLYFWKQKLVVQKTPAGCNPDFLHRANLPSYWSTRVVHPTQCLCFFVVCVLLASIRLCLLEIISTAKYEACLRVFAQYAGHIFSAPVAFFQDRFSDCAQPWSPMHYFITSSLLLDFPVLLWRWKHLNNTILQSPHIFQYPALDPVSEDLKL